MDNTFESPSVISICTGIRGLERGVERVIGPLRAIAYVEIEAFIIENLLAGMEAGLVAPAPIWANLKTFPWGRFRHKIFLLMGGYPCQPFSTAGLRKGESDPRHLWPYIELGIAAARPVCVFFENVRGHLDLGAEHVIDSLRSLGYAVEPGIYSAEEVGAPHQRARLFILGILADAKDSVRGLYERSRESGSSQTNLAGTSEMDNACGVRYGQEYPLSAGRNGFESSGDAMADAIGATRRSSDPGGYRVNSGEIGLRDGWEEDTGRSQPGGATLADSSRELFDRTGGGRKGGWPEYTERGQEVANPNSDGSRTDTGGAECPGDQVEGKEQRTQRDEIQREWNRPDLRNSCPDVADSSSSGLQGREQYGTPGEEFGESGPSGSASERSKIHRWPSGPGEGQFDWEAPRVIESGMGCSTNGYNFKEDLLRALGNGVVEQQAEYAFRNLLRKHFA